MKPAALRKEQGLIAFILLVSGVGSLCLLLLGTLPLRAGKNELLTKKVRLERRLAAAVYDPFGGPPLVQQLMEAQSANNALQAEWDHLKTTVQTFSPSAQGMNILSPARESRIDFKIELFNARQRLAAEAGRLGASIPLDLGLAETISATEDAEIRFRQLAATDRLISTLLQAGIRQIRSIEPDPIRTYDLDNPEYAGLQEYPISVAIQCSYAELIGVLERLGSKGSFFALRAVRIEQDALESGVLHVHMTCGAEIMLPADPGASAPDGDSADDEDRWTRRREIK